MEIALKDMEVIRKALKLRADDLETKLKIIGSENRPQLAQEMQDCRRLTSVFDELILRQ